MVQMEEVQEDVANGEGLAAEDIENDSDSDGKVDFIRHQLGVIVHCTCHIWYVPVISDGRIR